MAFLGQGVTQLFFVFSRFIFPLHFHIHFSMSFPTSATGTLQSKPHFDILDGLRGLAAIVVVIFHFMEIIQPDFTHNFIAHGFLAVDFFFCLSGFVIAYAYDNRADNMGIWSFVKRRLIRLHPLVIIGSILGILTFYLDPYSNLPELYSLKETALIFLASMFMIPYPVVAERFYNLFNLNAPSWSLFWEYMANFAYILVLFKLKRKLLIPLLLLATIGLYYVGWNSGNLVGGWSGGTFLDGLARVSFSFLMGLLIYRSNWIIKNNLGLIGMSALLLLAFMMPFNPEWNWLVEPLLVTLYFPVLVALGAGANLSPKLYKLNKFSGDLSYPLYMTHYPFIWVFLNYFTVEKPSTEVLMWLVPTSVIALIGFAYFIAIYVDLPIRKHLNNHLKGSRILHSNKV